MICASVILFVSRTLQIHGRKLRGWVKRIYNPFSNLSDAQRVELHSHNPDFWAVAYNMLGIASRNFGQIQVAIEHFETGLKYASDHWAAIIHGNLSYAHSSQSEFGTALHHGRQSVTLSADERTLSYANGNIGIALIGLGQYDEAEAALLRDIDLAGDKNAEGVAHAEGLLGTIDNARGFYSAGIAKLAGSVEKFLRFENDFRELEFLSHLIEALTHRDWSEGQNILLSRHAELKRRTQNLRETSRLENPTWRKTTAHLEDFDGEQRSASEYVRCLKELAGN